MNSFDKQALDRWITREQPDNEPEDGIEAQPEPDVPDVYDRLQQVEDDLHATRDALTVARADLYTLARAQGGPLLLTVLAHINEMPPGFCYCDDCRNASSIRILARIWKEGRQREGQQ